MVPHGPELYATSVLVFRVSTSRPASGNNKNSATNSKMVRNLACFRLSFSGMAWRRFATTSSGAEVGGLVIFLTFVLTFSPYPISSKRFCSRTFSKSTLTARTMSA